jgi:ATP-dependent Lon protease
MDDFNNTILITNKKKNFKKNNKLLKLQPILFKKLSVLTNHNEFLFKQQFINKEQYIEHMDILNDLYNKINNIINVKNKLFENHITEINNLLKKICLKCGSENLLNVLDIFIPIEDFFKNNNENYIECFKILNEYFTPLSCNVINENSTTKIEDFLKENNIKPDDKNIHVLKLLKISKNATLTEKINGASILFIINDKTLIYVNGYFKKDSLNICKSINKDFNNKLLDIFKEAEFIDIPNDFKENYIEQISLKDFILMDIDEIINMIKNDYNEFLSYKNKSLSILIKEFIKSSIEKQRKLIILFLLSDQDSQFTAHIIFDLISDKTYSADTQYLSDILFKSLHWKIQKIFKVSYDKFETNKNKLENITINDIPYESRILTLKTTEHIKNKAMEKLKEINGSKDNSIKAQQWLDGFLKLPFNIYKKEPIISFLKDFQNKIDKYIDTFTLKIFEFNYDDLNSSNKNVHNLIIQIIDEYHANIYKSENSYMMFIKYLNNIKNDILNEYDIKDNNNDNIHGHIKGNLKKNISEKILNNKSDNSLNDIFKLSFEEDNNEEQLLNINILSNTDIIENCMKELNNFKKIKDELIESNSINENNLGLMANKLTQIENSIQTNIFLNNFKNTDKDDIMKMNNEYKNYILKNIKIFDSLTNDWYSFLDKKREYMNKVDKILDNCTYGQSSAKKQMKRIIGQWMNGTSKGQCFGLCGPPGVGKTTLCKNGLAKCLFDENGEERPFAFLPLGGATNGSILEGHHYTYMGSTWGKIVDILMETKCLNPIIYIDELDKISKTEHGKEIISILTHITDQSQNKEFFDRYFSSIPIDLSHVLFIFSYNDSDSIDRILKDRIQEIEIKALNLKEKLVISQSYVIPEILENVGFSTNEIIFENDILTKIINEYTYECGVRKLNEILYDIVRDINLKKIMGTLDDIEYPIHININTMDKTSIDILSNINKINIKKIHDKPCVGLVNGLYATSGSALGGITIIQVMRVYSDKKFSLEKLTGSQGDVMKESMNCAMTLAWNILPNDIKKDIEESNEGFGIHIHCPEGATPKDGPSAGGTITLGIISRLTGIPVRNDIALTGEIDLMGNSLAIGGLHSKLNGAYNVGIKKVLIPYENKNDLELILKKEIDEYKEMVRTSKSIKNLNLTSFDIITKSHDSALLSLENKKIFFRDTMEIVLVNNIYDVLKHGLVENNLVFV